MVIWKWMLKICENLLIGTLFEQLPHAQIRSKFKNSQSQQWDNCAEHWNCAKISFGAQVMGIWKKVPPKVGIFKVAYFKQLLGCQILTKSKNFKIQHKAKSLKLILGFGISEKSHFYKMGDFLMDFYTTPYFFLFSLPLCTFFCNFLSNPPQKSVCQSLRPFGPDF